jgi:hypothetical protein
LSRFQQPTQNQTDDIKPTVKKTTKLRSIRWIQINRDH